jgi:hypothetical protein
VETAIALKGTLDSFGLAEVLQLLVTTGRTGCLSVEGDGGEGRVWVRDGAVAAASTARVPDGPLDEVLCDLLRYEAGTFVFALDERSPAAVAPDSFDRLLDRAERLLAEWQDLRATVPSLEHRVRLIDGLPEGHVVTVTARQWPILLAVGKGCTVADLATRLELTELNVLRTVHDLLTTGLVSVAPTRTAARHPRRAQSARLG